MDSELLLTDKEIARALEQQKIFRKRKYNLEDAIGEGDRLIAKAQLAKVMRAIKEEGK